MLARSNAVASKAAARVVGRAASVRPALAARRLHSGRGGQRRQQYRQGAGAKAALGAAVGAGAVLAAAALASQDEEQQQVAQAAAPAVNWDAVRNDIVELLEDDSHDDGSYGPILVRLAWHASGTAAQDGTGGSNGATMRFHPECAFAANAGLETARKRLEPVKAKHPGLSYADLWTFAGKVAIEEMAGPEIPWGPGRTDAEGGKACPPDGRLPDAAQGASHVRDIFYRMGFNDREIVALIGAHALGRCHTGSSGYDGPWTRAPTTFSNEYYRLLLEDKWNKRRWKGPEQYENKDKDLMMLPADMALAWDSEFRRYVELYAADEELFFKDFAAAFGKLLALNVPASQPKKGLWKRIFG